MKHYVVAYVDYDEFTIFTVVSDKDLADKLADKLNKLGKDGFHFDVYEHDDDNLLYLLEVEPEYMWEFHSKDYYDKDKVELCIGDRYSEEDIEKNNTNIDTWSIHVLAKTKKEALQKGRAAMLRKKQLMNEATVWNVYQDTTPRTIVGTYDTSEEAYKEAVLLNEQSEDYRYRVSWVFLDAIELAKRREEHELSK